MKIKNLTTEIDQNQKDVKQVFIKLRKLIEEKDKIILEIIPQAHGDQVIFNSNENGIRLLKKVKKIPKRMKSR